MKSILLPLLTSAILLGLNACNNQPDGPVEKEPILLKKDKPRAKNDTTPHGVPVINIADTASIPLMIVYVKDSASNGTRLSQKLNEIYDKKLSEYFKKQKLTAQGPAMAWYKSQKAPFFFEAGIPVDKKPGKLPKGFFFKKTTASKVIVAHFFGPYEETTQAYQVLKDWIKESGKQTAGAPYEIYVGNPYDENGKPIDPYKVQTDIVYPYK